MKKKIILLATAIMLCVGMSGDPMTVFAKSKIPTCCGQEMKYCCNYSKHVSEQHTHQLWFGFEKECNYEYDFTRNYYHCKICGGSAYCDVRSNETHKDISKNKFIY